MPFNDLFRKPIFHDHNFRMVFPAIEAKRYLVFSKYALATEYRKVRNHQYDISKLNPRVSDNILDFETEGRWFCSHSESGRIPTRLTFELRSDYAMFRLMGFGE